MEEKKTVLIVDDEQDTVTYFSTLLEDNGYATNVASDGEKALSSLKESLPDLITLDMSMPAMSGLKFYRTIKESEDWSSIPIIIITGISKEFESFINTRKQVPPPDGYISKPIDQFELISMVKDLVN